MEDGNFTNVKDDKTVSTSFGNFNCKEGVNLTANGHDHAGETSSPHGDLFSSLSEPVADDNFPKRVNPVKIHLGKRPFVDNSVQYNSSTKKKTLNVNRPCDPIAFPKNAIRAPKLIPKKKLNRNPFHNVASQNYMADNESDKPVPRLVPKSQLLQFKKSAAEKAAQMTEHPQNAGQPMVKFKCRKCCSMSFRTLAMLKEHQLVCRAQSKEPALSPEAAQSVDAAAGGPSRVTRKVYLCSACGTYYENWNLFLHMREVHNRHICLFCLGMFSKAEKLSAHLTNKHNVQEFRYESKEEFCNVYNGTLYLMCCECDEICSEQDDFFHHDCSKVKPIPVPVLVSKNAAKINNLKQTKNNSVITGNGPNMDIIDTKSVCDNSKSAKRKIVDQKPETVTSLPSVLPSQHSECEPAKYDTSVTPETITNYTKNEANLTSNIEKTDFDHSDLRSVPSTPLEPEVSSKGKNDLLENGDEGVNFSDDSNSPTPMEIDDTINPQPVKEPCPPPQNENCGIKLKLSLNKANSPVIINSTVDPTIGIKKASKPPSRSRRPPKRYEKDTTTEHTTPVPQQKTPSIKMTICDKADSTFVKYTLYENKQPTLEALLNNNLEAASKSLINKTENTILTTIYDNKLEDDINTLNRVPKLTVRVPKELLDKDSSSDYSSDSDVSDKLTVDENKAIVDDQNKTIEEPKEEILPSPQESKEETELPIDETIKPLEEANTVTEESKTIPEEPIEAQIDVENIPEEPTVDEPPVIELKLDRPLDKYPLKELLRLFLASTVYNCIYCNHVRKIAINCEQLSLHMAAQHRFTATVDSITAEELMPETITTKITGDAEQLRSVFISLDTYDSEENSDKVPYDHMFECFQCYFKTAIHKDLYLHNRKMHQKTILLCVMCKSNFYSYSELLCHLCPGAYDSEYEIKFRCCLCSVDCIPSSFRLMVHLRKIHNACDVCLEFCYNQAKLSNHVWKHKLHHLCYRCGIAYRNKQDITKHLFWKHGTESVLCKRCLQKKWPHVYHFCTPPAVFVCDECNLQFSKAVSLKVHKRFHTSDFPHACTDEGCSEKFVSKKLLMKHLEEHQRKLATVDLEEKTEKKIEPADIQTEEPIPIIDLVDDKPSEEAPVGATEVKAETATEPLSKKAKKKKLKEKEALLLDVNLPELNLSESDSSDESDSGVSQAAKEEKPDVKQEVKPEEELIKLDSLPEKADVEIAVSKVEEKLEPSEDKPDEQQVLDIWDNFKKYQAKTEPKKEKTPPLVPIKKHVCESDHDYCLIPADMNGGDDPYGSGKKKRKKEGRHGNISSSSSSSSSDSDSSCSCGSNCSCSSSSGSSSSSSSDSDSSDEPNRIKKKKQRGKKVANRRTSNGSNVDVMGMSETPVLIPEKIEPPVAETDLETEESETDEEFYDEHPQRLANKLHAEKRNQLMLLASVAPSDGGSMSGEFSRPATPPKEIKEKKEKSSSKKKSKKKKRSKSSRKHEPIKIHIPKDVITNSELEAPPPPPPNKITISLQSNTVQIPLQSGPTPSVVVPNNTTTPSASAESKRASKRRRVPNKFYGYSSDEDTPSTPQLALKPQQPPKLEWRKEDLPSPVTHRAKKEAPAPTAPQKLYSYPEPIKPLRLKAPIPDPEPPRVLMESSESDSSEEGALEMYQPPAPVPPPTYLNSGTSSLPYAFQRPAGRQAREGESVYCYCRCPYDEVSEMIACDADGCAIEWFHFECVGIMVPPKGKWYCPECRKKQTFSGYR